MRNEGELEMQFPDTVNCVRRGNTVFFHCECNEKTLLMLRMHLLDIRDEVMKGNQMKGEASVAIIDINSAGGEPHDMYSFIKNLGIPVVTCVSGFCASAATLIALAGSFRTMSATSFYLIHGARGAYEAATLLKEGSSADMAEQFKKMNETMLTQIYKKETKIPAKLLREMLIHREIILTAQECLEYKIVDSIMSNNGVFEIEMEG